MNILVKSWKGQETLATAFWFVYVLGFIVLYFVIHFILGFIRPDLKATPIGSAVAVAVIFPYFLYAAICVWRCGKNANVFWKIITRVIMLMTLLMYIALIATLKQAHG